MKRSTFQCFQRKCFNLNALPILHLMHPNSSQFPSDESPQQIIKFARWCTASRVVCNGIVLCCAIVFICLSCNWMRMKNLVLLTCMRRGIFAVSRCIFTDTVCWLYSFRSFFPWNHSILNVNWFLGLILRKDSWISIFPDTIRFRTNNTYLNPVHSHTHTQISSIISVKQMKASYYDCSFRISNTILKSSHFWNITRQSLNVTVT